MNRKTTESEEAFVRLCSDLSISCSEIPTEAYEKTPDYLISLGGQNVIVEIKQIEPNQEDIEAYQEAYESGSAFKSGGNELRLADRIGKANQQLKKKCGESMPGMVVVFDEGTFAGTDFDDIKCAMFGSETVSITFEDGQALVGPIHRGRKGALNKSKNTTTSAVALLCGKMKPNLSLFHNVFARCPIAADLFRHERFRHYRIGEPYRWVEV